MLTHPIGIQYVEQGIGVFTQRGRVDNQLIFETCRVYINKHHRVYMYWLNYFTS